MRSSRPSRPFKEVADNLLDMQMQALRKHAPGKFVAIDVIHKDWSWRENGLARKSQIIVDEAITKMMGE